VSRSAVRRRDLRHGSAPKVLRADGRQPRYVALAGLNRASEERIIAWAKQCCTAWRVGV
jgi:hypothetical protein